MGLHWSERVRLLIAKAYIPSLYFLPLGFIYDNTPSDLTISQPCPKMNLFLHTSSVNWSSRDISVALSA